MIERYTGDPQIIQKLGTNPEERGLTADEFKAKFDEFAEEFVAWFNQTHCGEVDGIDDDLQSHKAESVSQVVKVTRDISLSGDQVIGDFTDIPRCLTVYAFSESGTFSSVGVVPEVGKQGVMADFSGHYLNVGNRAIALGETSNGWMRGTITINNNKTVTITWAKQGTGAAGTVNLILLALYHGGV